MKKSSFNPAQQENDISSKIVVGLERISEVFKHLLWEKAKRVGLSPIQIQLLIFVTYHEKKHCTISQLAAEFNVSKPTTSDAVKALVRKKLVCKEYSAEDGRRYTLRLTKKGEQMVEQVKDFAQPLKEQLDSLSPTALSPFFETLAQLVFNLNTQGLLDVQRCCYGCVFYKNIQGVHRCELMKKTLMSEEFRLDCPEYQVP